MKRKRNILLIGLILIMGVLVFSGFYFWQSAHRSEQLIAVIMHDNEVIEKIDLNQVTQPRTIKIAGDYHNIIYVEKGRIRFEESDCPTQYCVKAGWLTKYGDIAVCLPNKTLIDIENGR